MSDLIYLTSMTKLQTTQAKSQESPSDITVILAKQNIISQDPDICEKNKAPSRVSSRTRILLLIYISEKVYITSYLEIIFDL